MGDILKAETETLEDYQSDWTPKQTENWDSHGKRVFESLKSSEARLYYRSTYRPKKRGSGMMERNHVKIGTPEHYYLKYIEGLTSPWGNIQGEMMAKMFLPSDVCDDAEKAAAELVAATTPRDAGEELAREHAHVAALYGL